MNIEIDLEKEFKAGDFTSGKMGEIFQTSFMSNKVAIIKHKQFGRAVLVPESDLMQLVNFIFYSFTGVDVERVDGKWVGKEHSSKDWGLSGLSKEQIQKKTIDLLESNFEGVATESNAYQLLWYLTDSIYTVFDNDVNHLETIKGFDYIDGVDSETLDKQCAEYSSEHNNSIK